MWTAETGKARLEGGMVEHFIPHINKRTQKERSLDICQTFANQKKEQQQQPAAAQAIVATNVLHQSLSERIKPFKVFAIDSNVECFVPPVTLMYVYECESH